MRKTCHFYFIFQALKVLLINIMRCNPSYFYFLLFYISFYISRYQFSELFRTSFNISYLKNDFRYKFSFLIDSLKAPNSLTAKICKVWHKFLVDTPLEKPAPNIPIHGLRDTLKVIQSLQLHVSYQMRPYSSARAIW